MSPQNIVVIGGGIAGSCTAYFAALSPHRDEGCKVTLVEGTKIAAAASGYSGGFLAKDWHGSATSSLAAMSYDLHASLANKFDGAKHWGYRTVETLSIEYDATRPANANAGGSSKPVLPWLSNEHIHTSRQLGTHETTAQVHPGQFTTFIVDRFKEQRDTEVIIGRAHGLDVQDGAVKGVKVGGRTVPADVVVICAGPWTGALAVELLGKSVGGRLGVTGHRAHSVIFKTKETLTPHCLFTNMTMRDGRVDEPEVYCRPDGTAYFCGAGDDEPLPPTAADVRPSPANIARLYAQAAELTPHFTKDPQYAEVVAEQACYLPIADRGKPLIGKVPGVDGVYVGSGLSCWGITQGPGTGLVLSEMILEGKAKSANVSKLAP